MYYNFRHSFVSCVYCRKSTDQLSADDDICDARIVVETDLSDDWATDTDCYLVTEQRDDLAQPQSHSQVRLAYLFTYSRLAEMP